MGLGFSYLPCSGWHELLHGPCFPSQPDTVGSEQCCARLIISACRVAWPGPTRLRVRAYPCRAQTDQIGSSVWTSIAVCSSYSFIYFANLMYAHSCVLSHALRQPYTMLQATIYRETHGQVHLFSTLIPEQNTGSKFTRHKQCRRR